VKLRLFYFVADTFPAWRSDVLELFGRELPQRGLEVTWGMRRAGAGFCSRATQEGQTVHLLASLGKRGALAKVGSRLLEALCEPVHFLGLLLGCRADVVQVRDDRYLAAFWAWLAARLTGARFVYWLSFPFPEHDAESAKSARGLRKAFLRTRAALSAWWLYRVVLRRVDHAFVQSESMAADIAAYGIDPRRLTPVPMGVPMRLLDWAASHRPEVRPGLVVYIGTLAVSRRLATVIEAFAIVCHDHPDARLLMVGDGDRPNERESLERCARDLGIADRVRFTGFLPMDQAWELAAGAAVGLSPFFPDRVQRVASPTKLVEYMAMGRPVVCNDHPEQSAIIRESGAGLSVPWGAKEFAEAIGRLLDDPRTADEMGGRGPAWVSAHRSYRIIADDVWRQYCRLTRTAS
jgi:glycosyltransferase involved in cell wall biosynthesis